MRLTAFTDYSLRVLIYLAADPDRRATVGEIAQRFDIKQNHLTKVVHGEGEDAKVAVRNLRREANEHLKKLLKDKLVTEDDERRAQDDVQKLTDRTVAEVDRLVHAKEAEIMAV